MKCNRAILKNSGCKAVQLYACTGGRALDGLLLCWHEVWEESQMFEWCSNYQPNIPHNRKEDYYIPCHLFIHEDVFNLNIHVTYFVLLFFLQRQFRGKSYCFF